MCNWQLSLAQQVRKERITFIGLLTICLLAIPCAAEDATPQIKSQIDSLQQSLKDRPVSTPDIPEAGDRIKEAIKASDDALEAGRLYLSLEKLSQAMDLLHGARAVMDKTETVKSGLPAFEAEWGKASLQLTAFDEQAKKHDWARGSLAIRAVAETAQGRSIPLLEGARGFATANGPKDGLFYLGEGEGEAEFARFCSTLNTSRKPAKFALRSFLPELYALQEKTNAAFQPPRSIDQHTRFIMLNSALKLARELDASRSYAGALYQYLEATRNYGMLFAAPVEDRKQVELKSSVAAARKQWETSGSDDSLAMLFVERAESYVAHPDGSAPTADEWRSAQIILDQVLPAYVAAQKPAAPVQSASGKTINLTLVRWPYT